MADGPRFLLCRFPVPPADRFDAGLARAGETRDLSVRSQLDVADAGDAVDEIPGHARGEAGTAHQHPDFRGVTGEENRGLSFGVAAAPEHPPFARAHLRFHGPRPVPDTAAFHGLLIIAFRAS